MAHWRSSKPGQFYQAGFFGWKARVALAELEGEDSGGEGEQGAGHYLEDDKELELPEEAGGDS